MQKLAQTRDAIGAHKAPIASPSGFSKGAIDVAETLGIALWVIAKDIPISVMMGVDGLKILRLSDVFYRLRSAVFLLRCEQLQHSVP